jgi:probable rRNA maturation factor
MAELVDVLDEDASGVSPEAVSALVRAVLDAEATDGTLAVVFVGEPVIADLNLRYRGLDEPTDVLSFPEQGEEDAWPAEGLSRASGSEDVAVRELGEVVVCPAVVRRYAAEEGNDVNRQFAWTIVHGVLHLLGYDHEIDKGEMRKREQTLLIETTGVAPHLLLVDGD